MNDMDLLAQSVQVEALVCETLTQMTWNEDNKTQIYTAHGSRGQDSEQRCVWLPLAVEKLGLTVPLVLKKSDQHLGARGRIQQNCLSLYPSTLRVWDVSISPNTELKIQ